MITRMAQFTKRMKTHGTMSNSQHPAGKGQSLGVTGRDIRTAGQADAQCDHRLAGSALAPPAARVLVHGKAATAFLCAKGCRNTPIVRERLWSAQGRGRAARDANPST